MESLTFTDRVANFQAQLAFVTKRWIDITHCAYVGRIEDCRSDALESMPLIIAALIILTGLMYMFVFINLVWFAGVGFSSISRRVYAKPAPSPKKNG